MPTYGLLVSIGVLVGLWISVRNSQKQGINPEDAWNLGILVVLFGILGAKILYIVVDWSFYMSHPGDIFSFSTLQAGGVFSGGLIGAFAAAFYYIHKHGMPALATCDAFAPGLALGHSIGRLGCFAAGCCWGKPTSHFWGVTFTNPLAQQWVGTPLNVALEPTQLFESAIELAIFVTLTWMFARKKFDGQIVGAYFFLYGFARYFLEFIRDDPGRGSMFGGIMTGTQFISLLLVIVGGFLWWLRPAPKAIPVSATR
jgi:phosphatidylglycerol:prolipoprotein diacylglycerol transferase